MPPRRADQIGFPRGLTVTSAAVLVFALARCAPLATVATSAIPPVPPQQARVWFYRDAEPSGLPDVPQVRLNGAISGVAYQGVAFYRDVPPGHYHVTVDSMVADVNQASDIDLGLGREAYIKVVQLDDLGQAVWGEPTFAVFHAWHMPDALGRAEVRVHQFQDGNPAAAR